MNRINNLKKYELLNQTLEHLTINNSKDIQYHLTELEGDYYSFLNPIFLTDLHKKNIISETAKIGLECIFNIINSISPDDWNNKSFMSSPKWILAKEMTRLLQKYL